MTAATFDMAAAALWYARNGIPVFPCGLNKKPLTDHGFKDASVDLSRVAAWWEENPEASIGVPTGAASGFLVLDVDPRHGGPADRADLAEELGGWSSTLEVQTGGGGRHVYFKHPGGPVPKELCKGIELKGDGSYVIVPPSNHESGRRYEVDGLEGAAAYLNVAEIPTALWSRIQGAAKAPTNGHATPGEPIPTGQRNNTLASLGGTMRKRGMGVAAITAALLAENAARCQPPLPEAEVRQIAASVGRYEPAAKPESEGARPVSVQSQPFTDSGNAERLEALHGADLRYVDVEGKWYAWQGARWAPDETKALLAAKDVARRMYAEAATINDDGLRAALAGWGRKSESAGRRAATLQLARAEGRIPASPAEFDADPWLFNCENGVVDLRTGDLRPHRREDFITKCAPVWYDPAARSDLWERFLDMATGGDVGFREFLMKAAGYCLTGDTREEKLFMVLGPAATGKSSFIETLRAVLGEYSRTADFESFVQRRDSGIRNDLAGLVGRRLVVSIEVEQGRRLAEALLKSITGRDTLTARFLYGEFFEFQPQFKLWLVANDAPVVRHGDEGIWRRILRLPFEHVVPAGKRDPTLKTRLTSDPEHKAAVLAWAVEGCLRWQESGLAEPERVRGATAAYRAAQNPLQEFVADVCELGAEYSVGAGALRRAYARHAEEQGYSKPLGPVRFAEALRDLNCVSVRSHTDRLWQGIKLNG